jgi:hypothetical protein
MMIPNQFVRRVLAVGLMASIGAVIVPSAAVAGASSTHHVNGCAVVDKPTTEHHTDCPGAQLSRTNLSGANLSYANFSGADLTYANLAHADLSRADLSRAKLTFANIMSANLSRAELADAYLYGAMAYLATYSDAHFHSTMCPNGQFTKPMGKLEVCPRLERRPAHR